VADAKQIEMLQADNAQLREQIAELRAELAQKADKSNIEELTAKNKELSDKNAALERSMTALTAENVSLRQDFARLEERFGVFQQAQANVPTAAASAHETLRRERRSNSAPSFFASVVTVPIPPVPLIVAEEKNTPNAPPHSAVDIRNENSGESRNTDLSHSMRIRGT
jgi:chromosome segregation ATPase